jgi:hypothetical protein
MEDMDGDCLARNRKLSRKVLKWVEARLVIGGYQCRALREVKYRCEIV